MKKCILLLCLFLISTIVSFSQSVVQHIVQRGETKEYLASKYGISVEELMDANPLFTTFYTGISVNIPVKQQVTTEEVSKTSANGVESVPKTKKKNSFWSFLGQVFVEALAEGVSGANSPSSQAYSQNQGFNNYTLPMNGTSYVPSGAHFDYAPYIVQSATNNYSTPSYDYTIPSWMTEKHTYVVDTSMHFLPIGTGGFVSNDGFNMGVSTFEERQLQHQSEHEALKQKNNDYYKEHYGYKDCHICRGSGRCQTCNGSGLGNYGECPNCLLVGGKRSGKCSICSGKGKVYGTL